MLIFMIVVAVFACAMTFLGLGYIFQGRCIRGTCSGEGVIGPDGAPLLCATCPKRKERECEAANQ